MNDWRKILCWIGMWHRWDKDIGIPTREGIERVCLRCDRQEKSFYVMDLGIIWEGKGGGILADGWVFGNLVIASAFGLLGFLFCNSSGLPTTPLAIWQWIGMFILGRIVMVVGFLAFVVIVMSLFNLSGLGWGKFSGWINSR